MDGIKRLLGSHREGTRPGGKSSLRFQADLSHSDFKMLSFSISSKGTEFAPCNYLYIRIV